MGPLHTGWPKRRAGGSMMISIEWLGVLAGIGVSLLTLLSPLVRLNGLLTRLNALLESLNLRTLRCEDRLDEHEARLAHLESRQAETAEAVRQAHHRLDEQN